MADKIKMVKALRQSEIIKLDDLFEAFQTAVEDTATKSLFKARYADIIKNEFSKQHAALVQLVVQDKEEMQDALKVLRNLDTRFHKIKAYYNDLFLEAPTEMQQMPVLKNTSVNLPSFTILSQIYPCLLHHNKIMFPL